MLVFFYLHITVFALFLDCPSPPLVFIGTAGNIIGNPPYQANEIITYECATNYTIHGITDNTCSGPPNYNWTRTGYDLPSCLRSISVCGVLFLKKI